MTAFDKWLRALAEAGKGGIGPLGPVTLHCDRGAPFSKLIAVQGDLTGATIRGEVRANPDAVGTALATFTVSSLTVAEGVTSFTLSLTKSQVNALPADTSGEGVIELVFDLLITLSGGSEQRLFGGIFKVSGQVTA